MRRRECGVGTIPPLICRGSGSRMSTRVLGGPRLKGWVGNPPTRTIQVQDLVFIAIFVIAVSVTAAIAHFIAFEVVVFV